MDRYIYRMQMLKQFMNLYIYIALAYMNTYIYKNIYI